MSSSSSSTLTDEQRRRIEENRRKALAIRAAKSAANANLPLINTTNLVSGSVNTYQPITSTTSASSNVNRNVLVPPGIGNGNRPPAQSIHQANQAFQPRLTTQQRAPVPAPIGPRVNVPFTGRQLTGICTMIARDRFKVEIAYNPQVIAIFKSINGGQYDTSTKTWNFPLTEHSNLLSAMEPLRPAVSLGGLPSYVLRIFRNCSTNRFPEIDLSRIDPVLLTALMPFQRDGVLFGISKNGRVLIADDMGLGKTIQALGIAHYYVNEWPLLIVAPSSMRYAWREAIWNWLPTVPAASILVMESSKDLISGSCRVLIVSYDLMQRKQEDLLHFKVIIMDESHHLKNPKAARTKAAMPILQESKRAILLSGTPALSRPIELFPQLSAISRNLFYYQDYGIRYCSGKKTAYGWDNSGSSNMSELSLILEETVMIRRLKSEVLQQLPPKIRKAVILDPSQIKISSAALRASAAAFSEGMTLRLNENEKRNRLIQFFSQTAKVKLPAVCAYIKDLVDSGKKIICFAHHLIMLNGISSALNELQCQYIRIDGSTNSEDRQYSVDQFQSRDDIRVAVLSIVAANSGITLTAANVVIFSELYWNPGILTQAEDRAHRIGQADSVLVEYLLAKGTSDDIIWGQIKEKLDVLNKAGLSKDDFKDVESRAVLPTSATGQTHSLSQDKQRNISDFFHPTNKGKDQLQTLQAQSNASPDIFDDSLGENMSALDDEFLNQAIEKSFTAL